MATWSSGARICSLPPIRIVYWTLKFELATNRPNHTTTKQRQDQSVRFKNRTHMPQVISIFTISHHRTKNAAIYQMHHSYNERWVNSLRIFNLISILCTWNSTFGQSHTPPLGFPRSFRRQIDFRNKSRINQRASHADLSAHRIVFAVLCFYLQMFGRVGKSVCACVWLFWNANHAVYANSWHSSANASVSIWSIRMFRLFKILCRFMPAIESKSLIKWNKSHVVWISFFFLLFLFFCLAPSLQNDVFPLLICMWMSIS